MGIRACSSIAAIPIEELAESSSYLEVCHLLLFGELPTPRQWEDFNILMRRHTMVHEGIRRFHEWLSRRRPSHGHARGHHRRAVHVLP